MVKFRQGAVGTAALISEVICSSLLVAGGVPTLEGALVAVNGAFAASYATKPEIPYAIREGLHYGTVLRLDVENGPPLRIDDLAEPAELVDLWVFDSWLCNIDRELDGNTLLTPIVGGRFGLIAADQSDCLGGSGRLADGTWTKVLEKEVPAPSIEICQRAIFDSGGADALRRAVAKICRATDRLDEAIASVPPDWWLEANTHPEAIREALEVRSRRMEPILNILLWEGLTDDIQGGHLL